MNTIRKIAAVAIVAAAVSPVSGQLWAAMPGAGGTWTIAANEEVTLVESDMAAYNALAKVVVNGKLTFSGTTAPAVVMEGSGVCEKTGSADWTLSTACPNYKGMWIVNGGVVDASVAQAFGSYVADNDDSSALYIRSGATLKLTAPLTSGYFYLYKRIHIAGAGVSGNGAIWAATTTQRPGYIGYIVLDGDATINMPSGTQVGLTYGEIRLGGYELTFTGGERIKFSHYHPIGS